MAGVARARTILLRINTGIIIMMLAILAVLHAVWTASSVLAEGRSGPDVIVQGGWHIVPGDFDVGDPLDPLPLYVESPPAQVLVTIRNVGGTAHPWQVYVRRAGGDWPPGVKLEVRRSDDGHGGRLNGDGAQYIPVTLIDTPFFKGTGEPTDIGLQYRVRSTGPVPAGSFHVDVVYTIVRL